MDVFSGDWYGMEGDEKFSFFRFLCLAKPRARFAEKMKALEERAWGNDDLVY